MARHHAHSCAASFHSIAPADVTLRLPALFHALMFAASAPLRRSSSPSAASSPCVQPDTSLQPPHGGRKHHIAPHADEERGSTTLQRRPRQKFQSRCEISFCGDFDCQSGEYAQLCAQVPLWRKGRVKNKGAFEENKGRKQKNSGIFPEKWGTFKRQTRKTGYNKHYKKQRPLFFPQEKRGTTITDERQRMAGRKAPECLHSFVRSCGHSGHYARRG